MAGGRPKLGDSETKRLHMAITESELLAIDEWQHENRVPSKSEAIRKLIQVGLKWHGIYFGDSASNRG